MTADRNRPTFGCRMIKHMPIQLKESTLIRALYATCVKMPASVADKQQDMGIERFVVPSHAGFNREQLPVRAVTTPGWPTAPLAQQLAQRHGHGPGHQCQKRKVEGKQQLQGTQRALAQRHGAHRPHPQDEDRNK